MLRVFLTISALIVIAVLWFMWRLPDTGDMWFTLAPTFGLFGVWGGLVAVVVSAATWYVSVPDHWLPLVFLGLDPAALCAGIMVLWTYRKSDMSVETIAAQRLQAWIAITLGLIAVAIGYTYVMTNKAVFTPIGQ